MANASKTYLLLNISAVDTCQNKLQFHNSGTIIASVVEWIAWWPLKRDDAPMREVGGSSPTSASRMFFFPGVHSLQFSHLSEPRRKDMSIRRTHIFKVI